ncbi:MAG: hypothetical protein OK454_09660, partial [Thaumarchaeota archaeon]|nr:hypothetical protein [Nitrososphaerota archaeon]
VQVHAPGDYTVQAWKVDENLLYTFIAGAGQLGSGSPTNHSYLWFEKNTLLKIRASENYTDPNNNNYIVSVETLEDTNIPQLRAALTGQEMNSTQFTNTSSSSASSDATRPISYPLEWVALVAIVAVAVVVVAMASYFARRKNSESLEASVGNVECVESALHVRPRVNTRFCK